MTKYRFHVAVITLALGIGAPCAHAKFTKGREEKPLTPTLVAGDYIWKPQVSPAGPVVVIVSLPEQTLHVYRNGIRIGRSTISSGKNGHRTPTGVFTILQKNVKHTSSIYKGASMPYMQRLTWGGIAMHAGQLPGYPASHGCVRLPVDFAQKLYQVTSKGSTTVIVTGGKASSGTSANPGLLLASKAGDKTPPPAPGTYVWTPKKAPKGPVSILFSSVDQAAYVYRNGVQIGRAAVSLRKKFSGSHAYSALAGNNADGSHNWQVLGSADGSGSPDLKKLSKNLSIAPEFLALARPLVTPGTTLILTDQPVNATTRSAAGFNILTAGGK